MPRQRVRTAAVVHLGCPKNLTVSEEIAGRLARGGWRLGPPEGAEVTFVNSCGFIGEAKRETLERVLELVELKKAGRLGRIVFTGCMAGLYREELVREIPEIDEVVEPDRLDDLLGPAGPRLVTTPGFAYLRIAEGCGHDCAFCIIPQLTGPFRSRPARELVEEARGLEAQGARELVLVAQDSTQYGSDLRNGPGIAGLAERLLRATAFPWIRVMYLYPETFPFDLLDLMKRQPRLLPYFDLPFQHASPAVLKRMKRGGSPAHFLRLVARIRKALPGAVFRSSFIVGYPGETGADVGVLERFLKDARLDRAGFFLYSDEPEAASRALDGKVPKRVARERLRRLAAVQKAVSLKKHRALVGGAFPVMVESTSPFRGRLASMAPEVDGHVALTGAAGDAVPGAMGSVAVIAAFPYHVRGRWHGQD